MNRKIIGAWFFRFFFITITTTVNCFGGEWWRDNCATAPFICLSSFANSEKNSPKKELYSFFGDSNLSKEKSFLDFVNYGKENGLSNFVVNDPNLLCLKKAIQIKTEAYFVIRVLTDQNIDHYLGIWYRPSYGFIFAEGKEFVKYLSIDEILVNPLLSSANYSICFFRNDLSKRQVWDACDLDNAQQENAKNKIPVQSSHIFHLDFSSGKLSSKLRLSDLGISKIDIKDVTGSCSCFEGYSISNGFLVLDFVETQIDNVRNSKIIIVCKTKTILLEPYKD